MTFLVHATPPCFHRGSMRLSAALTCAALLTLGVARADAYLGMGQDRCIFRGGRCYSVPTQLNFTYGGVNVRVQSNTLVEITCKDVTNICDKLPFILLPSNNTLYSVTLTNCPLPETFSCLLERLGAADAERVTFDAPRGELRVNNIEGLKKTTRLTLYNAAEQSSVPYDVIRALPSLERFRVNGAKLHLPADELSKSDETGDSPAYLSLPYVDLSSDLIKEVPHGAFRRFKVLHTLILSDNLIRNINKESFIGMESLQSLDLSRNPFKILPPGVFAHIPRLMFLILMETGLEEIPNGAITGQMLEQAQATGKLDSCMRGPYRVVKALPHGRYELQLLAGSYGKSTQAAAEFMVPWRGEWTPETCAAFFEDADGGDDDVESMSERAGRGNDMPLLDPVPSTSRAREDLQPARRENEDVLQSGEAVLAEDSVTL